VVLFTFSVQMPELFVTRPLPLRSTFIHFFYSSNHSPLISSVDPTLGRDKSKLALVSFKKLTNKMNE